MKFFFIGKQFQEVMTVEEKQKLYKAIDYKESSGSVEYPKEFVALRLSFSLNSLNVSWF